MGLMTSLIIFCPITYVMNLWFQQIIDTCLELFQIMLSQALIFIISGRFPSI